MVGKDQISAAVVVKLCCVCRFLYYAYLIMPYSREILVCICSSAPVMPILYIYCAAGKKKYQFATTSAGGVASLNAQLL